MLSSLRFILCILSSNRQSREGMLMCDWIEKEIENITEADIVVPSDMESGFETRVEGAVVPLLWRKVHTRIQRLRAEQQALIGFYGIASIDEVDPAFLLFELFPDDSQQLASVTGRMLALESAFCGALMAEHNLWEHVCIVINSSWEVSYRTLEQEERFMQALEAASARDADEEIESEDDGLMGLNFDPDLN